MSAGTVTILITDFIGSTPLFAKLGDEGGHELRRSLFGLLREAIASNGGREFKSIGDGLMVAFPSSLSAVECAVAMQQSIARRNTDDTDRQLGLAIGLSVGEPIEDEGDYFGAPVNLTMRLCQMASPGHIVVSGVLRAVVGSRGGYKWKHLGPVQARGMGSVDACALLWRDGLEQSEAIRTVSAPDGTPSRSVQRPRDSGPITGTVTILFLDVVDSTPISERIGDAAYRAQSRELDGELRAAIRAAGGAPVEGKVLGDGVMGIFHSASSAIEAALSCNKAASKTDLQLHAGLHAGDVIDEGDNVYGWAVNVASRVCTASAPGEVLISETVRALARASVEARFEDRGLHELKGIEEPQRLYAVRAG